MTFLSAAVSSSGEVSNSLSDSDPKEAFVKKVVEDFLKSPGEVFYRIVGIFVIAFVLGYSVGVFFDALTLSPDSKRFRKQWESLHPDSILSWDRLILTATWVVLFLSPVIFVFHISNGGNWISLKQVKDVLSLLNFTLQIEVIAATVCFLPYCIANLQMGKKIKRFKEDQAKELQQAEQARKNQENEWTRFIGGLSITPAEAVEITQKRDEWEKAKRKYEECKRKWEKVKDL